jgi:hypothetical protein
MLLVFASTEFFVYKAHAKGAFGLQADKLQRGAEGASDQKQREADFARQSLRFVQRDPYVPYNIDYGLEFGSGWGRENTYHFGANLGTHLGRCVFSESQTCQQYADALVSNWGREGQSMTALQASLRWQFVNFPSSWSPFARIALGGGVFRLPGREGETMVASIGYGVSTYLHPRADLRIELRVGIAEVPVGQVMFSFQVKTDRWLSYFATKARDLGYGAVSGAGAVLKTTAGITGQVVNKSAGAMETVIETTGEQVGNIIIERKNPVEKKNPPQVPVDSLKPQNK